MTTLANDLNGIMEFDHPVVVDEHGTVTDAPADVLYVPEVYTDGDPLTPWVSPGWSLLSGYSGQDRYAGPIMHPSEFIGGSMALDILATPGVYVAVVVTDLDAGDEDDDLVGWAVARRDDTDD
jgi:hypothetical protein